MQSKGMLHRQTFLVELNIGLLDQAAEVLNRLNDDSYRVAGAQFRHVIEFYECFLEGLPAGRVDYDARRRELALEQVRTAALARIVWLRNRFRGEPGLFSDGEMAVRVEDASAVELAAPFVASSVGRELQSLASHSVHHFALIRFILHAAGFEAGGGFGVAPSTLRHWANRKQVAA